MSADEALEKQKQQRSTRTAAEAIEFGQQFVKILEDAYSQAAADLPAQATQLEFRRAMMRAVEATLVESGAHPTEIRKLFQDRILGDQDVEENVGWPSESNARRVELIDKSIQQSLSAAEAIELDRLTARLRLHVDREELVPLQGARQLHRRLLERKNPATPPE